MERGNEWSVRVAKGIGQRVAYYRKRADLTAVMLSARCEERGLPLDRNVIAKLENGHRNSVTVDEVYVLAAALDVPPLLLLFGVGTEETAEVLPGNDVPAFRAAQWVSGAGPLPGPEDAAVVTALSVENAGTARPLVLYREHDRFFEAEVRALGDAAGLDDQAEAGGPNAHSFAAGATALRQMAAGYRAEQERLREQAQALGIRPPDLAMVLLRPEAGLPGDDLAEGKQP
jgi:transcriptional regulator with XRE-family HTH domain